MKAKVLATTTAEMKKKKKPGGWEGGSLVSIIDSLFVLLILNILDIFFFSFIFSLLFSTFLDWNCAEMAKQNFPPLENYTFCPSIGKPLISGSLLLAQSCCCCCFVVAGNLDPFWFLGSKSCRHSSLLAQLVIMMWRVRWWAEDSQVRDVKSQNIHAF